MQKRDFGTPEGRRVNLSRFLGFLSALEARVPQWHLDLFERTYVALELDMMGNKSLNEKIFMKSASADVVGEKSGSTSVSRVTMDDKLVGGTELKAWHSIQNRTLRSAAGAHQWICQQARGASWSMSCGSLASSPPQQPWRTAGLLPLTLLARPWAMTSGQTMISQTSLAPSCCCSATSGFVATCSCWWVGLTPWQ
eukprot:3260436-Lingulodinium_polyedra.AAC.1